MLPIEKETSRVATTKPLDELFTNVGQKFETETVKHEGYRFDYPLRWLRDPSVTKAIGFRRMKFISEAIHGFPFTVGFEVRYYNKEKRTYEKFEQGKLLQVNLLVNLETTLQAFQEKINDIYLEYANQFNIDEGEYHLDIIYDRKNATVKINRIEDLGENVYISTKYNNLAWYRFMRMLNQPAEYPVHPDFYEVENPNGTYENVFDSDAIIVHASFSGAQNSFLCLANDFYEKPTKLYEPPSGSISDFQVWFTTDGRKRIVPLYHAFYLELSFIYNYYRTVKI
ncbi:hypothetical protein TVAG_425790 [Trichomonas vaginalis G3]|uniref:DUF7777 domain-containing protein n=1 Tax=Trichomonas vaginalis (strain ATCC PRA-98 / G3) TaxID=412133 RepID=A2FGW8_TRIV3|nr:hypothetical protein TVAGG3_1056330 [Trichomonas vaginalis G3]EAX95827.1 hypothetical protein TVAG_425790 [Trichomonas vaginalis G3]KAI5494476.1 hypothetical protein TVAGG3_1056330 [Trichomonas vaginalis G3]|eukprot:XP_001308757.1 hypothetical protein [Trichomonas vaginalis G3]